MPLDINKVRSPCCYIVSCFLLRCAVLPKPLGMQDCPGLEMMGNLNLTIREDKIVVWRRITIDLKYIYEHNKDFVIKDTQNIVPST